jgi:hypothetical protein
MQFSNYPPAEIPKLQSKAVSKFHIPINRPSQSKLEAVMKFKQKQSNAATIGATTGVEVSTEAPVNEAFTQEVHQKRVREIQEKIRCIVDTNTNLQKEEENLRRSNKLIKNEISSLNDVQGNLLWLLKKANQFETQRNHSPCG